ncbi:unnamed protein product [marine sediment metagenome]|uniref:Uncharacterized protein n=1 Tax=marine sediment metagenome TaxID=412755 RepID=X1JUN0_9ZZZZ
MTLKEAIKELEEPDWMITEGHTQEYSEAVQLGIEALKRLQRERVLADNPFEVRLPGETEERTVGREGNDIRGNYFYEERQK